MQHFDDASVYYGPRMFQRSQFSHPAARSGSRRLLALLEAEEASGTELVVLDTRPGTHADTEDFCLISDLVLIPARPVFAEWEMTHRAVLWMDDLRASIASGERFLEVRVLVIDAGPKIIDAATREGGMTALPKRDLDDGAPVVVFRSTPP